VVVQTSDNEGTPVALIEAQAAGVPVVSTRVGGVATVVEDGVTGRIVEANGEGELASAVRACLCDGEWSRRAGATGRHRVLEEFSLDRLVSRVADCYEELLTYRRAHPKRRSV
jgi:glycosyltransferase involved in cell wall biosynthesis